MRDHLGVLEGSIRVVTKRNHWTSPKANVGSHAVAPHGRISQESSESVTPAGETREKPHAGLGYQRPVLGCASKFLRRLDDSVCYVPGWYEAGSEPAST